MLTFRYQVVASPLHDRADVERVTATSRRVLNELGGVRVASPDDADEEPYAILVATGGTEATILSLVERRRSSVGYEPVLLFTHPLHNSLPAALEALARLRHDGLRGRIVPIDPGAPEVLTDALAEVAAMHRLRRTRLGLVGEPSDWLVASVPEPAAVRERWGVELVPIDISRPIEQARGVRPPDVRAVAVRFSGRREPSAELSRAAALHPALLDAVHRADLDAVTVRCFDFLEELTTSGCVALAELNDSGIVAGCEGDVASAVAMLLVRVRFGQVSWMANPASVDVERDCLVLAHCTVAPSMVEDVELHTHFESGLGIGLRGRFAPGWVTLLRLGGDALEEMWVAEGEIEDTGGASPDLCRTQLGVRLDGARARTLLESPLGNHLVVFRGRHRAAIESFWRLAFGD